MPTVYGNIRKIPLVPNPAGQMNPVMAANRSGLYGAGVLCWSLLLVVCGTYLRIRPQDQAPSLDWVVLLQLSLAALGGAIGCLLVWQNRREQVCGWGCKALVAYVMASLFSIAGSPYPVTVGGYWVLLTGATVLTIGLVKASRSLDQLQVLEKSWLIVMSLLLVKDAVHSLVIAGSPSFDVFRLGTAVTHPVSMSMTAVLAFFISFRQKGSYAVFWWLLRCGYLLIILLARTRMSFLAFGVGAAIMLWLCMGKMTFKGASLRFTAFFGCVALVAATLLAASFGSQAIESVFLAFTRNQDFHELMQLSSRVDVWPIVLRKCLENPVNLILGHGYGVSRLILIEEADVLVRNASNAHNTILESVLCLGLPGFVSCCLLYWAGLRWPLQIGSWREKFSFGFSSRAVVVVALIMLSTLTESVFAVKIDPIQMIFFYYVVAAEQSRERMPGDRHE